MATIPTYEERVNKMSTIDDLDDQMNEALKCARDARFAALWAETPEKRFMCDQDVKRAESVIRQLRLNEDDIEAALEFQEAV